MRLLCFIVSLVAVPAWVVAIIVLLVKKYGELDSPPALIMLILAFPAGLIAIAMSVYILAFTSKKVGWFVLGISLCGCGLGLWYPDVSYRIEEFMGELAVLRLSTRVVFFVGIPVLLVHSCFALMLAYAREREELSDN